jgi:mannitol-1-/sugar-/sorbitol-6-phosphatase
MRLNARAVIFDSDGVLVDSDDSVVSAWSRWAWHYGLAVDDVVESVHGRRSMDTVAAFLPPDVRRTALALIDAYEIEHAAAVGLLPGARDLLEAIPPGQWAVVTSGTRALARARLRAAGLLSPAVLVSADDVTRGKPDPEGYLRAATILGIPIGDAIVVEDSPSGIRAARRAGARSVVGVSERARGSDADVLVPDLRALTWMGSGLLVDPSRILGPER